jgi:hypothetical protein
VVYRLSTTALVASYLAPVLAFASAAVRDYWALGGTALLDTVGGALGGSPPTTALLLVPQGAAGACDELTITASGDG